MGTVTGYTAAKMKTIEDGTVVNGSVSGDNLILVRHDGTTINVGSVRGPQGIQGPGGGDLASVMQLLSPVGSVQAYAGSVAPTGWKICDGVSLLRTDYTALFNAIGTAHGFADSTHFNIPDLRQRMPLGRAYSGAGSTLGAVGGNKDAIVASHNHNHAHGINIGNAGGHTHGIAGDTGERIWVTAAAQNNNAPGVTPGTGNAVPSHVDPVGDHNHGASANWDGTGAGVSPTDANMPPYIVINYIIRY